MQVHEQGSLAWLRVATSSGTHLSLHIRLRDTKDPSPIDPTGGTVGRIVSP